MKEFLRQVAETFLENVPDGLQKYCFVFPNRRSSLFFRKYLGQSSQKPIFSPTLITINDLFSQLSGLTTLDKTSLLYELYLAYSRHIPDFTEKFDDFIFWGDMILNDFDDIDKYLVDAKKLFTNIRDLKEIDSSYDYLSDGQVEAIREFWKNFIPFREEAKEQSFISVWDKLYDIYEDFRNTLFSKGYCYDGMSYRAVVEVPASLRQYEQVVFVGLNALNHCEKRLLNVLRDEGIADFYWDYYGKIIRDKDNKSSLFMDDNVLKYPSKYHIDDDGSDTDFVHPQNIQVIGIPSNVGQVKYVGTILKELISEPTEEALFSTSIVLPDENLLQPLLNSIPSDIRKINVTMGYTLSNSNVSTFMSLVADLQRKIRLVGSKVSYYHTTVLDILAHPFMRQIASDDVKMLRDDIVSRNMIYVAPEILKGEPILRLVFNPLPVLSLNKKENIRSIAAYQLAILEELQKHVGPIEREFIYHYYTCINRLSCLDIEMESDTYFRILSQTVSTIAIPFKGEPLAGLQIMGPLETRALDFENVIILSVNEGTFPSRSVSSSFIPYNLRKGFDLPTYEHLDSISAYHFYRSIYRAKNIYLLYDTRTEGTKTGEVSRYVKQLKYHHQVPLEEHHVTYKLTSAPSSLTSVEKNPHMLDVLKQKAFSASSLNTYMKCPMQFYFQYVEGMKEADEVSEEVEADTFGSMFHSVMENIYRQFEGKDVLPAQLHAISSDHEAVSSRIRTAFKEIMFLDEISGKNKIVEALLERYVVQTLEFDESQASFRFLSVEKKHKAYLKIPSAGLDVLLYGIIDRMDLSGGHLRVVDYKTGGVSMRYSEVGQMFDMNNQERPYTAFQLAFYLLILQLSGHVTKVSDSVMSVYSLKNIFSGVAPSFIMTEEELEEFKKRLAEVIDSIFDLSIPFTAAVDEKACGYCPFKVICNR